MGMEDALFTHNGKKKVEDTIFIRGMNFESLENSLLIRSSAKKLKFSHVNFNYCVFDNCYFRQCVFESCEFNGCKFISSNFNGSNFIDCNFIYSTFERSIVDLEAIKDSLPSEENLRAKLLRSLRVNYQQQGDVDSVNRVIHLELQASQEHLLKSWFSSKEYYRKKYKEWDRLKKFVEWSTFIFFDFVWGNGESVYKLCRTVLLILIIISLHNVLPLQNKNASQIAASFWNSPVIFFGINKETGFSDLGITVIYFLRLVVFGLFMSILIKRISRR